MSEPRHIVDKDGGSFHVGDAGEVWFPPFPLQNSYTEQLDIIKRVKIRDDDVIMTGYGKSGSHWHFEILTMLKRGTTHYVTHSKPDLMLDRLTEQEVDNIPSPRVLNTHVNYRFLPTEALEKKTKLVLLLRNPKDVCVSMFNHMRDWTKGGYNGTWEGFFNTFLETGTWYGNWFSCMKDWEKELSNHPHHPVFISTYEAMQKNPVEQIGNLNAFLNTRRSPEFCRCVAYMCNFHNLKEASKNVKVDSFPGVWKEGSPGFFRRGIVGDWKNWMSEEQNKKFDDNFKKQMSESKLDIVFEL
ncbi:sulfotransferase family cytosolic 1B member 1 [Aplysia californica]|uniref:Sulfotransferase family cytosolic 1B member 1 n=1 Tax=Aplysia californica TaxID=6500 RepID=A0ABM0JH44_APLCA|nr:sulfotransferase family cytosolic 1B member 1 [Aplysia californica]